MFRSSRGQPQKRPRRLVSAATINRLEALPEELIECVAWHVFDGGRPPAPIPYWAELRRKRAQTRLLRRLWGQVRIPRWAWLVDGRLACCEVLTPDGGRRDLTVFGGPSSAAATIVECFHARGVNGTGPRPDTLAPLRSGDCFDALCKASSTHFILFRGERVGRVVRGEPSSSQEVVTHSGGVLTASDDFPEFERFTHAACGESARQFLAEQNPHPVVHFKPVNRREGLTPVLHTRLRVLYLEVRSAA